MNYRQIPISYIFQYCIELNLIFFDDGVITEARVNKQSLIYFDTFIYMPLPIPQIFKNIISP